MTAPNYTEYLVILNSGLYRTLVLAKLVFEEAQAARLGVVVHAEHFSINQTDDNYIQRLEDLILEQESNDVKEELANIRVMINTKLESKS